MTEKCKPRASQQLDEEWTFTQNCWVTVCSTRTLLAAPQHDDGELTLVTTFRLGKFGIHPAGWVINTSISNAVASKYLASWDTEVVAVAEEEQRVEAGVRHVTDAIAMSSSMSWHVFEGPRLVPFNIAMQPPTYSNVPIVTRHEDPSASRTF
ncbi:hypothetical protein CLCR_04409 [Cladophialophora carrionii]|uniref:Uncharacterized protein n=1 Tax=Cladophialophora carrionii TaxID=86049 RepID=A0A1C1CJ54_9EURO|nr:hypothetical protein CLCR_04409 [Cladophialophora carrionii]